MRMAFSNCLSSNLTVLTVHSICWTIINKKHTRSIFSVETVPTWVTINWHTLANKGIFPVSHARDTLPRKRNSILAVPIRTGSFKFPFWKSKGFFIRPYVKMPLNAELFLRRTPPEIKVLNLLTLTISHKAVPPEAHNSNWSIRNEDSNIQLSELLPEATRIPISITFALKNLPS